METTEIKRYEPVLGLKAPEMQQVTDGEWVRWEDVKHLIEMFAVYQDSKKEAPNDTPPP